MCVECLLAGFSGWFCTRLNRLGVFVGKGFLVGFAHPSTGLGFLGSPPKPRGFLRGTRNLSVPRVLAVFSYYCFLPFFDMSRNTKYSRLSKPLPRVGGQGQYHQPVYKFFWDLPFWTPVGFELAVGVFGELVMFVSQISRCPLDHQALSENIFTEQIYIVENLAPFHSSTMVPGDLWIAP